VPRCWKTSLIGIDTDVLIAFELAAHPRHADARQVLTRLVAAGEQLAIAGQVLAEFVHVVTDGRRFSQPMPMTEALRRASDWMSDQETVLLTSGDEAIRQFLDWMLTYQLGRKRVLDTMLAATYHSAGVARLVTFNEADFRVFSAFHFLT
jgi:predicted nucleic acid-binding protein